MKKRKLLFLVFGLVTSLMGCKVQYDTEKQNDVEYQILTEEEYPQQVEEIIMNSRNNNFRKTYDDGEYLYMIVGYGAQPTSGYRIEVQEVYESTNALFVTTMLKGPTHGEVVEETESYPVVVIKVNYTEKPVVYQ